MLIVLLVWLGLTVASVVICIQKRQGVLAFLVGVFPIVAPIVASAVADARYESSDPQAELLNAAAALLGVALLAPLLSLLVAIAAKRLDRQGARND